MAQPGPALPPVEHEPAERGAVGPETPAEAAAHGDVAASRGSWGAVIAALGAMMVVAGIAMLVFPFVLDFVSGGAGASLIVCGGVTIFLGCLRMAGWQHAVIGLAAMAVGVWLFASSFFLGELAEEAWSARCLGAVIFFLGMIGLTRPTPDPANEAPTSDLR